MSLVIHADELAENGLVWHTSAFADSRGGRWTHLRLKIAQNNGDQHDFVRARRRCCNGLSMCNALC